MQTRSIGVSGLASKTTRPVDEVIEHIRREFGDRYQIEVDGDTVHVIGELHNHKIRQRLREIIAG